MTITEARQRIDLPTVIAIAAVAGLVANQLHEAGGHGGACLALGQHVRAWGAFYLDCDTHAAPLWVGRLVAAAGSTMNLLTAVLAFIVVRATWLPRAGLFWWLLFAVSGLQWAGYYLFSGVSGLGDWGASRDGVFYLVSGWGLWRILLAVGGGLLYWAWAIVAMRLLVRLIGADDAGRRQARLLCWLSYATIGGIAFAIGLLNPVGFFILLISAIASSFGATSGLLWAPFYIRAGAPAATPFTIARSWGWIVVAIACVLAEGLLLGPSLHF